jgi:uncharacterized protein (TIGR03435 family)
MILPLALLLMQNPFAEFEVASVKPNKGHERMYYGIRGGSMTVRNMSLKGLIQIAYGKRDFQITGGPNWITSETFDIDAKAERPSKATQDMLKSLLATRFNLALHSETKETSVYELVIAKSGLKMKLSADQTEPEKGGPKELAPGRMIGEGIPMYILTNLLSNALGYPVINKTGLTGKYDVNLQYVPDPIQTPTPNADEIPQADTSMESAVISALEKQLGVKAHLTRAPQEVLVVDSATRPSAN